MSIVKLTVDNFSDVVLSSDKPVLVDFFATWCGPCKMMSPVLEELASTRDDITVAKVDIDDHPAIAEAYEIHSIPTLILFKNGKPVKKEVGYRPIEGVLNMLK